MRFSLENKMARLNIELPKEKRQRMMVLKDLTNAKSLTELIGRALAVYEFLWENRNEGTMEVTIIKNGIQHTVVLIP